MNERYVPNDPLAVIYNEPYWRICRVSPMSNLEYSQLKLKQYASNIRQGLVSNLVTTTPINYIVLVEDLPYLRYWERDPNGLLITVSTSQENNSAEKIVYKGLLLSWGVCVTSDNLVHLPYMLENGELKIGTSVKATLQTLFDCNIKQYQFTQPQLLQFGFSFIENDTSRSTDPFILNYKTFEATLKEKVTLTFEVGDVHSVWNGIKDDSILRPNIIYEAYHILMNQVYYALTLNMSAFDLCEVSLSKADVKSVGIVKMKTPEMVNSFFKVINDISDKFLNTELQKVNFE